MARRTSLTSCLLILLLGVTLCSNNSAPAADAPPGLDRETEFMSFAGYLRYRVYRDTGAWPTDRQIAVFLAAPPPSLTQRAVSLGSGYAIDLAGVLANAGLSSTLDRSRQFSDAVFLGATDLTKRAFLTAGAPADSRTIVGLLNIYRSMLLDAVCDSQTMLYAYLRAATALTAAGVFAAIQKRFPIPGVAVQLVSPIAATIAVIGINAYCKWIKVDISPVSALLFGSNGTLTDGHRSVVQVMLPLRITHKLRRPAPRASRQRFQPLMTTARAMPRETLYLDKIAAP